MALSGSCIYDLLYVGRSPEICSGNVFRLVQTKTLIFGLFHGFGLATKLQELDLARNGLVTNIFSFNIGVEIGQVLALTAILIVLSVWRTRSGFLRHAFATNTALMTVGFILVGYQVAGYFVTA